MRFFVTWYHNRLRQHGIDVLDAILPVIHKHNLQTVRQFLHTCFVSKQQGLPGGERQRETERETSVNTAGVAKLAGLPACPPFML